MKKVLVTGGAGFIGSHLVDKLILENYEVVVVDNLSTGSKENLNKKAKFYKADITDKKVFSIFAKEKPEIVFHFAAQINVRKSVEDPAEDAKTNILGGLNILENCKNFGVKKVIFSSTGGAQGRQRRHRSWPVLLTGGRVGRAFGIGGPASRIAGGRVYRHKLHPAIAKQARQDVMRGDDRFDAIEWRVDDRQQPLRNMIRAAIVRKQRLARQANPQIAPIALHHADPADRILRGLVTRTVAMVVNRRKQVLAIDPLGHHHRSGQDHGQRRAVGIGGPVIAVQKGAAAKIARTRQPARSNHESGVARQAPFGSNLAPMT